MKELPFPSPNTYYMKYLLACLISSIFLLQACKPDEQLDPQQPDIKEK
jgi:hypothetical protein